MPTFDKAEAAAIEEVVKGGWVTQGEKVKEFENRLCRTIGLPGSCGVALSSGTASLYLALKVLNVRPFDEVIAPTYVCSAVLNAIYMLEAKPILTDVDKADFNISCQHIVGKITKKTKAIIVPHIFGVPVEVTRIKKYGIPVIEDCATALGSRAGNKHVGLRGQVAIFSFYASKVITTGQGGMLVSKNPAIIQKARDYRDYDCRKIYYPRFNFQMTDIQAAMGLEQLDKLNMFLNKRAQIAGNYRSICTKKGWDFQRSRNNHCFQNWYRFVLKVEHKIAARLKNHLEKHGIETIVPIEKWELLHNYLKRDKKPFENAEEIAQSTLSLPIYPGLTDNKRLDRILRSLKEF